MRFLILIIALLCCQKTFDSLNGAKIDSLKPLVKHGITGVKQNDTANIIRLNNLAAAYFKSYPDSTLYYCQLAQSVSLKSDYPLGFANGLVQAGHVHYFKGDLKSAKYEFDTAIAIFKKLDNKNNLAECYELYGDMLDLQAQYGQSLHYFNLALQLNKQLNNRAGIASCYKNIGLVNFGQGRLSGTLDFYYKALNIDLKDNNKSDAAEIYNNIGDVLQSMEAYSKAFEFYKKGLSEAQDAKDMLQTGIATQDIGEVFLGEKKYTKAEEYLTNALKIARKLSNQDGISYVDADMALCYGHQHQYPKALMLLDTALNIARQNKMTYDEAYAVIGFATVYNLKGDYKMAFKWALKGQGLAITLGNVWFRSNAITELYKSAAGMHNYQDAFRFSLLYNSLKDSLKSNESIQKITSYTLSLVFTAKQQQIELHHREQEFLYNEKLKQQRMYAIFGIIIIILLLIGLFHLQQRRRQLKTIAALGEKNTEILGQKRSIEDQAMKLNESNDLKDGLIAIMAHDLRAPLSTLRGLFDLLSDKSISIREALKMIPSVVKKLEYTSDFLDTLLYWINSQLENFGNSKKDFQLKNIVELEIKKTRNQATEKNISITESIDEDICLFGDPDSFRIVIHNLIINALKFSKPQSSIKISAESNRGNQDECIICVRDSGIGMSEERIKGLFKGKVSSAIGTANEAGTGMGLMFCKDLITKSGGEIWVTSVLNEGTEFFFTIPIGHKVNHVPVVEFL